MKFTINVDCTPEEAREFFGFPHMGKLQDEMMKQMQAQMNENMKNIDPQDMMKNWLPGAMENVAQYQKMMFEAMNAAVADKDTPSKDD